MAGPGGGAPRKSHTKSRKGCRTCKRRHIRCDELFPQCRNCTKHSVRCDYMDMPVAGEEPLRGSQPPDLLMSPELQRMLDHWRLTGQPPLSELQCEDDTYWTRFSTIDLRLIHHITTLSLDLHRRGYSPCTPWAPKMLTLITVAMSSDFTMSALLAMSASHLAWHTQNLDTGNLAYHYQGVALKGLHEAIGAFSERNSEAILAASMLLMWQATEWHSWASLQQGLSAVMHSMRLWFHKSELANFLESQKSMLRASTPTTPSVPSRSPFIQTQDLRRIEQMATSLHNLRLRLANHEELGGHVEYLINFLKQLRQDSPLQSPEDAFERLQPLRSLLFWLPSTVLRPGESDLGAIAMLCHFSALALVLEPLYPAIGGAYLGSMAVGPIESMYEMLQIRKRTSSHDNGLQVALSLVETPMQIAQAYKSVHQYSVQPPEVYQHSIQGSSYPGPHLRPASSPGLQSSSGYVSPALQSPNSLPLAGSSYYATMPGASAAGPETDYFQRSSYQPGQSYSAGHSRELHVSTQQRTSPYSESSSVSTTTHHGTHPYPQRSDPLRDEHRRR